MNYDDWTREKLIDHVKAYGASLHELAGLAMKQEFKIKKLEARLAYIDEIRRQFHAA